MISLFCIIGLFCSSVVAHVGNPPATIPYYGITQAQPSGYGSVFLAHVGTPEGWAFYDVHVGDIVQLDNSNYVVTSVHRYRYYSNGWFVDLSTGRWYLDVFSKFPNITIMTCITDPHGWSFGEPSDWQQWGRLIITAEPSP